MGQHERELFTRINLHHLVGQYRRVVIDCTRPGIQVIFIGHMYRQWCVKRVYCSSIRVFEVEAMVVFQVGHAFMS